MIVDIYQCFTQILENLTSNLTKIIELKSDNTFTYIINIFPQVYRIQLGSLKNISK